MIRMKRNGILSIVAAAGLVLSAGSLTFAQGGSTSTGTMECAQTTVTPGTITAQSANFTNSGVVTLGPTSQTETMSGSGSVADYTGQGDGWTLSETGNALTLESLANSTENSAALGSATLPTQIEVTNPSPSTGITSAGYVTLPNGGTVLTAAAGSGMGLTTFGETLQYTVPSTAYAGTYDTTINVEVAENVPSTPDATTETNYSCQNTETGSGATSTTGSGDN